MSTTLKPQKSVDKSVDPRSKTWFKPGNNANPGGRPKGASITATVRKELEKKVPGDADDRTYKQLFAQAMIKHAINGHGAAMGYILDRLEGKVKERIDHEVTNKISVEMIKQIREDAGLAVPKSWSK